LATITGGISSAGTGIASSGANVSVIGDIVADLVGVFVDEGAYVSVDGNVISANGSSAIYANTGAIVAINGSVDASVGMGVEAYGAGTQVAIHGDITAGGTGVYAVTGAQVTVDATITVPVDRTYIYVHGASKDEADYEVVTTKVGYLTYTDSGGISAVWVADPAYVPPSHSVAFDSGGGSAVPSQSVPDGGVAVMPADPSRGGYAFAGWYADPALAAPYGFSAAVHVDITLYAAWAPIGTSGPSGPDAQYHIVAFDPNGGSAIPSQSVLDGDAATKPADPSKGGYSFAGWYADSALATPYVFGAAVHSDIRLYAKWAAIIPDPRGRNTCVFTLGSSIVLINGNPRDWTASYGAPYLSDSGNVMIPIRMFNESLGFSVLWDGAERSISVSGRDGSFLGRIFIGNVGIFDKSGMEAGTLLDASGSPVAPLIDPAADRAYLPLRAVAQCILDIPNADVIWDAAARTVTVMY
jgi:uncharacterized repeat protein (TIGR02543 family)